MRGPGGTERETKIRVDAASARERLESAGAELLAPRHEEKNWVFDTPDRRLEREGRLLRVRRAGETWTLTLKGPARSEGGHKVRFEAETTLGDGLVMVDALGAAGLDVVWRYDKHRTLYELGGVTIALDETVVGDFLELEGEAGLTEEVARRLGHGPEEFLDLTYADLWEQKR